MTIPHIDRRLARLSAVQALYQMDMAGTDLDTICIQYKESPPVLAEKENPSQGMDAELFEDLVRGIVREQKQIDPRIDALLAKGWQLSRLDSILRAILRAGAYELLFRPDIPPKTVITEYLEISHGYFVDDEPKMVNGLLDKLSIEAQN